jgi:hypothetical protein
MSTCAICGGNIPAGSRTCSVCGSSADEFFPAGTMLKMDAPAPPAAAPSALPEGGSYCPGCAAVYGPEHTDPYCKCGIELLRTLPEAVPLAPILDDVPLAPILDDAPQADIAKPPPGTPCLLLYGLDKQPLKYFALEKDVVLIGRLDAVAANFPDIDLDEHFDRAVTRRISRQHALVVRNRATRTFALRPVPGNTGTQLETQMLQSAQDYPLRPGHRIILGGTVRLKFEVA